MGWGGLSTAGQGCHRRGKSPALCLRQTAFPTSCGKEGLASHFPKKKGGTSPYFTSDTGRGPISKKGGTSCYTRRNVQMPENGGASLFTRIKRQDVPSVFERGRFPSSPGKGQYCILLYDCEGWASRSAGGGAELPLVLCLTQRGRPSRCSGSTKGETYLFLKESCMPWGSEISHCFRKRVGTSFWLQPMLSQKKGCSLPVACLHCTG